MPSGPTFIRFFWPVLEALHDLGGSARPREVVDLVVEMLGIPDEERAERTKSGSLRVDNQVHWARNYLVWAGLLDGSKRGWWQLSKAGWTLPLEEQDHKTAYELFKRVRVEHGDEWGQSTPADNADPEQPPEPVTPNESDDVELATAVRSTVLALSPAGFESLCKRLLTELGLTQLRTVGQAGDRGIDVEGRLRVNPVVSFASAFNASGTAMATRSRRDRFGSSRGRSDHSTAASSSRRVCSLSRPKIRQALPATSRST